MPIRGSRLEGNFMSESIEAISGSSAFKQRPQQDTIKPETREKLEALGIDPSTVKTETEAQQKIKEAESAQANVQVNQPNQSNPVQQVIEDAKELAEKIGISVSEVSDISKLLETIDKQISNFEKQCKDDEDELRKSMAAGVRQEYNRIIHEFEDVQRNQSKITGNLDMLASYNKVR